MVVLLTRHHHFFVQARWRTATSTCRSVTAYSFCEELVYSSWIFNSSHARKARNRCMKRCFLDLILRTLSQKFNSCTGELWDLRTLDTQRRNQVRGHFRHWHQSCKSLETDQISEKFRFDWVRNSVRNRFKPRSNQAIMYSYKPVPINQICSESERFFPIRRRCASILWGIDASTFSTLASYLSRCNVVCVREYYSNIQLYNSDCVHNLIYNSCTSTSTKWIPVFKCSQQSLSSFSVWLLLNQKILNRGVAFAVYQSQIVAIFLWMSVPSRVQAELL